MGLVGGWRSTRVPFQLFLSVLHIIYCVKCQKHWQCLIYHKSPEPKVTSSNNLFCLPGSQTPKGIHPLTMWECEKQASKPQFRNSKCILISYTTEEWKFPLTILGLFGFFFHIFCHLTAQTTHKSFLDSRCSSWNVKSYQTMVVNRSCSCHICPRHNLNQQNRWH